jgi:hypothetical protein
MSAVWTINGTTFAAAGVESAVANFRSGAGSTLRLDIATAYDAAPLLSYDAACTVACDGTAYFRGKARSARPSADGSIEGQSIEIRDAWHDLEETIYQEPWSVGSGSVMLPIAVLGVASGTGARITTSQQITEAVNYAISTGVAIQLGSVPTGILLWPTEVRNISVAEVIRLSLRYHADWVPWIDHSTGPPTLNFTARSALTTRALDAADLSSVDIVRRDDLKPAAVRIVYLNATVIDGVVYRDGIVDKYPGGGPDSGPRVLSTVIELAGGQMQFQKSRIQTRILPTDQASAKTWLKKKFPHLKDVDPAHFTVTEWEKELVDDADDHPDPINPRAERLEPADADDLPRELVRGTIEDWMRKKVGRVRISVSIKSAAGATAAEKAAIAKGTPPVTVTATNAVTKIYKGITQFTAPEAAPTGIAQRVYESLSSYQYDGSVSFEAEDAPVTRYHGTALNITGGASGWSTMAAAVHQVSVDIGRGRVSLSVGPAPYVSAEDFLELQRLFRGRPVTWMSQAERTSNELGAENDPGSKGDTVSGYDAPDTFVDPVETSVQQPLEAYISGGKVLVRPGYVGAVMPTIAGTPLDAGTPPELTPAEGDNWLHLKGTYEPSVFEIGTGYAAVGSAGTVSNVTFALTAVSTASPAETYPKITGGSAADGTFDILWGKIVKAGDEVTIEVPSGGGDAQIVFMPPNHYVAFRNANASAPAAP